ncbi:hypothetical protein FH063_002313 [Azospirillum argentinense]|uniref:Uncharacterized protein n=1 Tax=Azospirillum argentinense TaxID=2970906 RepID=A0A5B0KPB8_9PROT|nr:hypothetical protein FH063_002313 [Azospirillum argentinense]
MRELLRFFLANPRRRPSVPQWFQLKLAGNLVLLSMIVNAQLCLGRLCVQFMKRVSSAGWVPDASRSVE